MENRVGQKDRLKIGRDAIPKKNFFSLAPKFTFFHSIRGRVEESRTAVLCDFTVIGFLEHNLSDSKAKNIKTAAQSLLNSNTEKSKKITLKSSD